jgi:hypothetical protein
MRTRQIVDAGAGMKERDKKPAKPIAKENAKAMQKVLRKEAKVQA